MIPYFFFGIPPEALEEMMSKGYVGTPDAECVVCKIDVTEEETYMILNDIPGCAHMSCVYKRVVEDE